MGESQAGAAGARVGNGRLERMERYLAGLPAGLDSYGDCLCKGSLLRSALAQQPIEELSARLPPPLVPLVRDPPVDSEWVAEARFAAVLHAIADVRGYADADFVTWTRDRNRTLFRNPAYRILMAVSGPGTLVRGAAMRWSAWHRGTSLEVEGILDEGVRALLRFPAGLFDGMMLDAFGGAFVAALELARAQAPVSRWELVEPGTARFLVGWAP